MTTPSAESIRRFPTLSKRLSPNAWHSRPINRYADAGALEQDLDLFLRNEPLSHVVNPSRRERLGNWLTRRRRILTTAACLTAVCAAYPTYAALKPPPIHETSPFLAAVRRFDMDKEFASDAVARFKAFEAIDATLRTGQVLCELRAEIVAETE